MCLLPFVLIRETIQYAISDRNTGLGLRTEQRHESVNSIDYG